MNNESKATLILSSYHLRQHQEFAEMLTRSITRVLRTARTYSTESNFTAYKTLKTDKVFHVTIDPEEYFKLVQQNKEMKTELDQLDKIAVPFIEWYKPHESEYGKLQFAQRNELIRVIKEFQTLQLQKERVVNSLNHLGYNEFTAYDQYTKELHEIETKMGEVKNKLRELE